MIKKQRSLTLWIFVCICIVIGVMVVCFYKHRYQSVTTQISVRLDWGQKPEDISLMNEVQDHVSIQIKGYKYLVDPLLTRELVYPIDFSKTQTGTVSMPIDPAKLKIPKEIEILSINPENLSFQMERIIEKEIPVRLSVSGTPAKSCVLSEIYLKPGMIVFNGPENVIKDKKISEFYTRELSLDNAHESFSKELPIIMDDSLIPYMSKRIVRVDVTLNEKIETREYRNIRVTGKKTPYRYKIRPSTVDLTFEGRIKALQELNPKTVNVYIDLKGLKPGVYARRVKIEVPGNVSLTGVRPEIFTITLYKSLR
jgi:YbbR domain-containing protein